MYLGLNELPAASTILSCTIWNRTRLTFHALAARICASALLMNSTQFCRVARVIPRTWPGSGYAAQEATGHGRSVNPGGAVNCGGGRSRSHPQAATVATTMATEVVRSRCSRTDASLRAGARRRDDGGLRDEDGPRGEDGSRDEDVRCAGYGPPADDGPCGGGGGRRRPPRLAGSSFKLTSSGP